MRLATKNGTTGRRRIRNSIDHWFSSIPSLIFFTTAFGAFSRAPDARQSWLGGQEDRRGTDGRTRDVEERAGEGGEEEAAGQRGDGRAGQREGDDQRVEAMKTSDGADVVGIAEGNQRLAVNRARATIGQREDGKDASKLR
jgi:hypothetical protein